MNSKSAVLYVGMILVAVVSCVLSPTAATFGDIAKRGLDPLPGKDPSRIAPFSFTYQGTPCEAFLDDWECAKSSQQADGKVVHTIRYRCPATKLLFELVTTSYDDAPAVDWICYIENEGTQETPIVKGVFPLDARVAEVAPGKPVMLRWSQGDASCVESFLPHDELLPPDTSREFAPHGGRSSNGAGGGALPFFNIHDGEQGWVLAVGWSGQWKTQFRRDRLGRLVVRAGMERTRFRLQPGQRVRTPRIVLLHYQGGEMIAGHNAFRQLVLRHYWRRDNGKPAIPPVCHNTAATVYRSGKPANEANQLAIIAKAAELGCEAYWLDAYWYPQPWRQNVGNWFPRPDDFPRGLKPLSDAAHGAGMKFVLWFEPERVAPGTQFDREHPEFLLKQDDAGDRLFNLGDSRARRLLANFLDRRIKQWGVDVYRNDFNIEPLPFWDATDPPDRQGVAQMSYIEGLYRMWAELLERNPGLTIDNCASGGRRIDLETCSVSYPLWRSDFNDIGQGLKGEKHWPLMGRANQVHVAGLSLYIPLHAGPLWSVAPYNVRSCMSGGVVLYDHILREGFPDSLARQAMDEVKELRPFFLGDYFPLMKLTTQQSDWWAYQLDRPDLAQGVAFVFRRPESQRKATTIALRNIDAEAEYEVSITGETYSKAPHQAMRGDTLRSLKIAIPQQPGSVLVRYRRVKQ